MSSHTPASFLFHDYETWGTDPKRDWPSQFAAIRTDADLNPIERPINWFCRIPNDYLPQPEAALVTGITPQQTLRDGYIEADFIARVHAAMSKPNTCVVGYNSIRFDDEVTRFGLFRNFYDPYAREWQNGNSRWDIIDLVRACYSLRPEGIQWPKREDGLPSFKLEHLSQANNLEHGNAHDALSDVNATIGLTRLLKQAQPKLFNYAFELRSKRKVLERIDVIKMTPIVHISSRFKAEHGCCAIVMPIGFHPQNKNAVICINLSEPIDNLLTLNSAEISELLYRKSSEYESHESRPALKQIIINRCPFVAPLATLSAENAARLGIDLERVNAQREQCRAAAGLFSKLLDVFDQPYENDVVLDPDYSLYQEPFLQPAERQWCDQVIDSTAENLAALQAVAPTQALKTRLFRYRARNYPNTLTDSEMQQWQAHRHAQITAPDDKKRLAMNDYLQRLEWLAEQHQHDQNKVAIIRALVNYAQNL
ncbi:exodeoxyribonuclease I [Alteromonas sp. ASW11-36]|uniref:Exodeoxyribonuclease I n=1 Tax=Alteromonas arenosi TaxID=3055817 RepID=A0ABT7SY07_9ALTE|nr:exodeoxyribonuclease I [Alteromonas sp. ASW11-36]MDM7861061.1 exodeoxyribonuclease I [Alteromonas sp. ASW11-36]